MSSCFVVTDCLVCVEGPHPVWASGRIGYERPLEAGCCTMGANHYVPQGRKGCRKCRPMLSHYLRPNTWPQKFLLESSSPGLGQFSVFSVIGVGQPRVPLFKYLEEQQERGIPSSVAVLSNMYTEPPRHS